MSGGAPSGWIFRLGLFLLSALLVTACGDGDSETPTPVTPVPTPPPPPPPPAPEPPPSVPENLRVSAFGEDFIEWSWDVVEGASGYQVQFSFDDNFTEDDEVIARAAAQNAYRRMLAPGAEAYLRVQSVFGSGDAVEFSEWSSPVRGRTSANLSADRAALVALFEATSGPIWTFAEDWLTDAPLNEWYGVDTDGQGRVTRLELGGNQLTGPLPPEIGQLARLEALLLYGNQLTGAIPPEVGRLTSLEALWLQGNELTGSIPPEIGQLARLQSLFLPGNQLTGAIPRGLANSPAWKIFRFERTG